MIYRCWTRIRALFVRMRMIWLSMALNVGGWFYPYPTTSQLQDKMFKLLGFTEERAQEQFGFLMNAFKYGAPPHGGLAYGLDRFVSLFAGLDSIRDCIAFPKNNSGRDVMLDAPGVLDPAQLDELNLIVDIKK